MAVIASLVVGSNGATTLAGSSSQLSTSADRTRFLELHRSAGAIITGRVSAEIEDYSRTAVPIYIFSRSPEQFTFTHPLMQQVRIDGDLAAIAQLIQSRTKGDVVVEAGPRLLAALVEVGAIDILELSLSPIDGDGNFIDVTNLLHNFLIESDEFMEGTRLLQCRYNRDAANS